jgi:hypothetical protein
MLPRPGYEPSIRCIRVENTKAIRIVAIDNVFWGSDAV